MALHAVRHRCCCRWRRPTASSCSPSRWSASARRSSTPSRRGWRGWRPAAGTASRSRSSRSAATPGRRSARCSRRCIVLPRGQTSIAWFGARRARGDRHPDRRQPLVSAAPRRPRRTARRGSRRTASPAAPRPARAGHSGAAGVLEEHLPGQPDDSFYTFYLIGKFGLSVQSAQLHLFLLLGARPPPARSSAGRSATASAAST